jgi:LCP family protein required for cell wall assembly
MNPTPRPQTPAGRSRWPLIAGVAALGVLVAVLLFVLLNQRGAAILPSPSPTPEPTLNAELLSNRMTVLVVGLDSDERRRKLKKSVLSDTIMVASINADQSEVTICSLPRDTVDIPLPDGNTWTSKINGIYTSQGIDGLRGAVSELLQIQIDYYVQIDMGDLVKIVDAVGGVRVRPKDPLVDGHLHLDLPAGPQLLDGVTAQRYVRSRYTTNDFARAGRQQAVLLQIVKRLVARSRDIDIPKLLNGLHSFETDLPLDRMPTLFELALRAQSADVTTQVLDPEDGFITFAGDRGDGRGYILEPDIDAMRAFAAKHFVD